jgi:hypothetical protein
MIAGTREPSSGQRNRRDRLCFDRRLAAAQTVAQTSEFSAYPLRNGERAPARRRAARFVPEVPKEDRARRLHPFLLER